MIFYNINRIFKRNNNPNFFIWSNDFTNFDKIINKLDINNFELIKKMILLMIFIFSNLLNTLLSVLLPTIGGELG